MLLLLFLLMYDVCMAKDGQQYHVARGSNLTLKCSLNGTSIPPQWIIGPTNLTISAQNRSLLNELVSSISDKRLHCAYNTTDLIITDVQKVDEGFYLCVHPDIGVHKFEVVVEEFIETEKESNVTFLPLLLILWLLLCTSAILYLLLKRQHDNEFLQFIAKYLKKLSLRNPKSVFVIVSCYFLIGWIVMFGIVLYKRNLSNREAVDQEMEMAAFDRALSAAIDPLSKLSPETEKLLKMNETEPLPVEEPPPVTPPTVAPLSIIMDECSANWISVKWKAIQIDKGPIDGYKVLYNKVDNTSSEKSTVMKVASDTRIKLDNLEPSVQYLIQVRAYNSAGDGPLSAGMIAETLNFEIEAFEKKPLTGNVYITAMKDCADVDRHLRVIVVGNSGHGKTSLTHQLLGRSIQDVVKMKKTVLHTNYCSVIGSGKWELCKKPSKLSSYDENALLISILDFSELSLFHETYHLFHGKNAIYLIVFDISKLLDNITADINSKERESTHEQHCLKFWVDSLCSILGREHLHELPIIFVGTHKDKLQPVIEFTSVLKHIFPKKFVQTEHSLFVVDNIQANEHDFTNLRKAIEQKFTHQYRSGFPKIWLKLEQSIMENSEHLVFTKEEIAQLNSKLVSCIKHEDHIEAFLQSRHHNGLLIHFNEDKLSNYTVKNPEYLLNVFSMICKPERCLQELPLLQLCKDRLKHEGYLENVLFDALIAQDQVFQNDKTMLVKFLQRFHLLCEVVHCNDENEKEFSSFYIVPSMLGNRLSHKNFPAFEKSRQKTLWRRISSVRENKLVKENMVLHKKLEVAVVSKSSTLTALVYVFKHQSVAITMYHRLTAAALQLWPVFEKKSKHLLCKHFGVYKVCEDHAGVISINNNMIELRLLNQSCKPVDGKYGDVFRRLVEKTIKQEFERLGKIEKMYEMHIRCLDAFGCKNPSEHWHDIVDDNIPLTDETNNNEAYNQWYFALNDLEALSSIELTEDICSKIAVSIIESNCEMFGTMTLGLHIEYVEKMQKTYNHSHVLQVFNLLKTWLVMDRSQKSLMDLIQLLKSCTFIKVDWDIIKNVLEELNSTDTELV